jgi:hypothetical protein
MQEAKGTTIGPAVVQKAASAFGNSWLPGFLLLGVDQDATSRAWTIDGWPKPHREMPLWVDDCLGNGKVHPVPTLAVRHWDLPKGNVVACIAFWPVTNPPVVVSNGQVWLRTSSKSVQVIEPSELRRLFDRGEAARSRAAQLSKEAAQALMTSPRGDRARAGVVLGFGGASVPSEVTSVLFRESTIKRLSARVIALQRAAEPTNFQVLVEAPWRRSQGEVTVTGFSNFDPADGYTLRAGRHGGVAIAFGSEDVPSGALWVQSALEPLQRIWKAAVATLAEFGAVGDVHIALRVSGPNGDLESASWSDMESDGSDELKYMQRDVGRAIGHADFEPEEA